MYTLDAVSVSFQAMDELVCSPLCIYFQENNRIYTLKKATATGGITKSAHPGENDELNCSNGTMLMPTSIPITTARFSPDDKFSRHRVTLKKRFGLLPTQQPAKPM